MKKPIAIIFNDAHLKTGNESETIDSVKHLIEHAKNTKVDYLIFAGDLFDSRSFQKQSVLQAFDTILDMIQEAKLTLYLFPGNHDKTLYNSSYSFLDIYRHHPCVKFNRDLEVVEIEGVTITLLPFFTTEMLVPMIEKAKGTDVLISHFEMFGSTHLGKVNKNKSITKTLLKKWSKVYLGHYHNHHEISEDIVHLPSLRQQSFGEDDNKGFTMLYDDLSYEIVQGRFKRFSKVVIDVNTITPTELKGLIKNNTGSSDTIRFEFVGDEAKLKAVDKTQFNGTGIDVKIKFGVKYDFDSEDLVLPSIIETYSKEEINRTFKSFCEDKGYDFKEGSVLLQEFLNK